MSTVVVVRKDKQVAIAADSLTKYGSTKEPREYVARDSKILKVGNSYIASVGEASFGLVLESYFERLKEPVKLTTRQEIFEMSRELHQVLKEEYFLNPDEDEEDEFESLRFDCLIANENGIFGLYALRSVQEYTRFYAFGTGYKYALGAMKAVYDSGIPAEEIAKIGVEAAAEFDDSTSLPLDIYTMNVKE